MVLPGALTNYLSLVEYRKPNKAPKRENRKLHTRTHTATTRKSHTAQLAHNSVDLSKWRALWGKLGGGGAVQQAKGSREVRWRVGHTGHTNITKRASSTSCAHVCARAHQCQVCSCVHFPRDNHTLEACGSAQVRCCAFASPSLHALLKHIRRYFQ